MTMPRWTLALALFLVAVGLVAYFATGRQSVTALIPAFLGAPLLLCALLGRREGTRHHAMHAAAVLALIGLGGTATGVVKTGRLIAGATLERPEAAIAQAVVALACLAYLVLAVRSFVQARRRRADASSAAA